MEPLSQQSQQLSQSNEQKFPVNNGSISVVNQNSQSSYKSTISSVVNQNSQSSYNSTISSNHQRFMCHTEPLDQSLHGNSILNTKNICQVEPIDQNSDDDLKFFLDVLNTDDAKCVPKKNPSSHAKVLSTKKKSKKKESFHIKKDVSQRIYQRRQKSGSNNLILFLFFKTSLKKRGSVFQNFYPNLVLRM